MTDLQTKIIELTEKFPELSGQRREDLCAAFSQAIEFGRNIGDIPPREILA